jgi:hypothetical protein
MGTKKTDLPLRALLRKQAVRILAETTDKSGRLIALKKGKPIRNGRTEIEKRKIKN